MDSYTLFHDVSAFFTDNKDLLTIVVATVGAALALFRYWRDRSWDKKQFAYDYAEKVFDDKKSMAALRMLDWTNGDIPEEIAKEYGLANDQRRWTRAEVAEALRPHDKAPVRAFEPKEYVIRELFDACLARFERLGHFMKAGVISATDFPTTLAYYPEIMVEGRSKPIREPLRGYMKRYKFDYACDLFDALAAEASRDAGASTDAAGMSVSETNAAGR